MSGGKRPWTLAGSVTFHKAHGLSDRGPSPCPRERRVIPPGTASLLPAPSVSGSHSAGGHTLPVPLTTTYDRRQQRDPDSQECLMNCWTINRVVLYGMLPRVREARCVPGTGLSLLHTVH